MGAGGRQGAEMLGHQPRHRRVARIDRDGEAALLVDGGGEELPPKPHQGGAGKRAGVAGEQAAEDIGLPPRAEDSAAGLGPAGGKRGHNARPLHQQVMHGIVDGIELGPDGAEGIHRQQQ